MGASTQIEELAEYSKYIAEDENIKSIFKVGLRTILLTPKRIIMIRKFPKSIVKMEIKDLELMEYYTLVRWSNMFYGALSPVFGYMFVLFNLSLFEEVNKWFPFMRPLTEKTYFWDLNIMGVVLVSILVIIATKNIFTFFDSTFGRLRITPYKQAPIEVITGLTKDVREFMTEIERHKKVV